VVRDVTAGVPRRDGLTVRTNLAAGLPRVRGDAVMLRRIVENLVENAVESLGAAPGAVSVTTAPINGARHGVALTVVDSGPGMTRQQLDRAFEDFFTTKPGGTGLGLSIVRRLVLDLEGTLRVETAPGQGAAFRVELPAAPPDPLSANAERGNSP
jgi:signal transduction histidine kinase